MQWILLILIGCKYSLPTLPTSGTGKTDKSTQILHTVSDRLDFSLLYSVERIKVS